MPTQENNQSGKGELIQVERSLLELAYTSYKRPLSESETLPDGKPLPKVTIDGKAIPFLPGDTIMQAAERANLSGDVPRYCYHPGLPIAGTCRMCTVEVEKAPKLMTSCSTPCTDGMVVHTDNDRVNKSRRGVMEFLLVNHPLDCPVCDQAGECELQDYNYEYGPGTSRFTEGKRVWPDSTTRTLSNKITLNMNRCVHCERCVRFTDDVTKTSDLVMLNRGWKKELVATDESVGLTSDYQGCLADICPVGALTWSDFRFEKRVWFLDKKASVCDRCAKGCNIEVHSDKNVPYRYIPLFNEKVNGHWMCDEGRLSYHLISNPKRVITPLLPAAGKGFSTSAWESFIPVVFSSLEKASKVLVIVGTDSTIEEAQMLKSVLPEITKAQVTLRFHNGTEGVKTSEDDKPLDHLLRRKDHTPNTKGIESLGLTPFEAHKDNGHDVAIVFRSGRAGIAPLSPQVAKDVWAWGLWLHADLTQLVSGAAHLKGVIPGYATPEKKGTFMNCDGISQQFEAAIEHKGLALPVEYVLGLLRQTKAEGPNAFRTQHAR